MNYVQAVERFGTIEQMIGLRLIANGPPQSFIGEVCELLDANGSFQVLAEVVGFSEGKVYLMPYDYVAIGMGYQVRGTGASFTIKVGPFLLGQMVNALAQPLTRSGSSLISNTLPTKNKSINPLLRESITERLLTGIHAIDGLLPIGKGQRMGIFAGSGVGKSMLLGQMVQNIQSDVNVIALIGERGREVNEFITQYLDQETRKKSILVVSCSDESALMRRQAAFTATTIAEYFCQQGKDVFLFMDSVTRFAMAQREIGLSLGEPPTTRGYTTSVFNLLPGLVERTGNFKQQGSISALYTVLVEGDDFNEPLADHMRSLLDGHIVLSREMAQRGHYPAISITQSISRLKNQLLSVDEQRIMAQIFSIISLYNQHQDLIDIGAYKPGKNPNLDKAVERIELINKLLIQNKGTSFSFKELIQSFREVLR